MTNDQAIRFIIEGNEQRLRPVCAHCEHELRLPQKGNESHGICKRHALEVQRMVIKMAVEMGNPDRINDAQRHLATIKNTPESEFDCPDLVAAQQRAVAPVSPARATA